jgi:hypothetical protein
MLRIKDTLISLAMTALVGCGGGDEGGSQDSQDTLTDGGTTESVDTGTDGAEDDAGDDAGTTDVDVQDNEDAGTSDAGEDTQGSSDGATQGGDSIGTTEGGTDDSADTDGDADGSSADGDADTQSTGDDVVEEEPEPGPIPEGNWHAVGSSVNDSLAEEVAPEWVDLAFDADETPIIAFSQKAIHAGPKKCQEESSHIYLTRYTSAGWTNADGLTPGVEKVSAGTDGEFDPRYASNPSVAVTPDGGIVVGWTSATTCLAGKKGATVMARMYNPNKGWSDLGEGSTSDFGITNTNLNHASRIRVDPSGRPVVIFVTANTAPGQFGGFLHVRRYEDLQWKGVGGAGEGLGLSEGLLAADIINEFMDLDFNPAGEPVVTWSTLDLASLAGFVLYKQHENGQWNDIDGSGKDPGVSPDYKLVLPNPTVAVTSYGRIHLAWTKTFTGQANYSMPIYASSTLPNGQWSPKGGGGELGILPYEALSRPHMIIGPGDRPYLTFIRHEIEAKQGQPNDAVGLMAYHPEEDAFKQLNDTLDAIPPTGWEVPRVGFAATKNKLGIAWIKRKFKKTLAGGMLHYAEYP